MVFLRNTTRKVPYIGIQMVIESIEHLPLVPTHSRHAAQQLCTVAQLLSSLLLPSPSMTQDVVSGSLKVHLLAGVDLVRIDGSFPSFSDDDAFILYNEGFTGVSAVARDGSNKQLIFKVDFHPGD